MKRFCVGCSSPKPWVYTFTLPLAAWLHGFQRPFKAKVLSLCWCPKTFEFWCSIEFEVLLSLERGKPLAGVPWWKWTESVLASQCIGDCAEVPRPDSDGLWTSCQKKRRGLTLTTMILNRWLQQRWAISKTAELFTIRDYYILYLIWHHAPFLVPEFRFFWKNCSRVPSLGLSWEVPSAKPDAELLNKEAKWATKTIDTLSLTTKLVQPPQPQPISSMPVLQLCSIAGSSYLCSSKGWALGM